jgi:lipopolysaccharide/colanic/teichoic acid biosynthesis glycosyltransferase
MYTRFKRLADLIAALTGLIVLTPVFLVIIFILKLTGEGEVLFFQKRIGKNSKYFYIWKFATMLKNSPNIGTGMITVRNDARLTPFGGFLRKTKINELPQLINVIKGDMSIVGPRPTVENHANAYSEEIRNKIYTTKPGITGIGSILFRDEEAILSRQEGDPFEYYKNVIIPYKSRVELWYQKHQSFITDLKIIILTFWVIIFPASKLYYSWFKSLPKMNF